MKHDYAYIALLDHEATQKIRSLQEKLSKEFGYSEYVEQWVPHITISFGNLLSNDELVGIKEDFDILVQEIKQFDISLDDIALIKKEVQGESFYTLRFKVASNRELQTLSEKVVSITKKYETPFDAFSHDYFHIGLGRYQSNGFDESKIREIIH